MTWITKTRPSRTLPPSILSLKVTPVPGNPNQGWTSNVTMQSGKMVGADSIIYTKGPRYTRHDFFTTANWKECDHRFDLIQTGQIFPYTVSRKGWWNGGPSHWRYDVQGTCPGYYSNYGLTFPVPPVNDSLQQDLFDQIIDNIDLNVKDSVMCYSATLQAIPMLGGVFKVNRILKKLWQETTRSMRRKPFTTVLKSLISADFLNRFVIQTTLDDMHAIANSMNTVLSRIATASSRNHQEWTVLEASADDTVKTSKSTETFRLDNGMGTWWAATADVVERSYYRCTVKSLAKLRYNVDIVSPIRVWANAVGLTRPLESMWDMVPFSFVVDYFLRTGDFVTHLSRELSKEEGLSGQVLDQGPIWLMSKSQSERSLNGSPLFCGTEDNYVKTQGGSTTCAAGVFSRHPVPSLYTRSFWDRGGLWAPQLSITRARTMAQLWLQMKL